MAKEKNKDVIGRQPSNEEQMSIRQSAPKPTPMDEVINSNTESMMTGPGRASGVAVDGYLALNSPIGKEAIHKATQTLMKYKEGKANLERKIVEAEQWYKLRHWECLRKTPNQVMPTSGWLFNSIANKHADAMDNYPSPNILPREEGDRAEAKALSSIIPVILEQNDFEDTYSDVQMKKIKSGTGVYGVFFDSSKLNGLGDISVKSVDPLCLFWEPGVTDIQDSRNMFSVELVDNETLLSQYPQLNGKLTNSTIAVARYIYDDTVDATEKSCVVDWYYKKMGDNGKTVLHYCKFVNDEVLFATENEPMMRERGLYDHGLYPFVFDTLFRMEGTPAGFGYIDIGKDAQEYIDRGNQAILQNLLANARPRHFIRTDGSVNEREYADMTKDFVHVDGNLGQDSILPIQGKPLSDIYVSVVQNKIEELKETTGNRDVSTGGTTSGVTAGSAIAAMQEAGSKLSRDANKQSFRSFRKVCNIIVELIRQFYDLPRYFRILGENGAMEFIAYSNAGIQPQPQGLEFGTDMGMRTPMFDIEVTAEKMSPYSKMSQNELALQFYSAGFFNPQMADQALACLEMMDFPRKEFIMQKISQNSMMFQQMMALAQIADAGMGANGEIVNSVLPGASQGADMPKGEDEPHAKENTRNKKARERVQNSTDPS